jgi:hypothetical protein
VQRLHSSAHTAPRRSEIALIAPAPSVRGLWHVGRSFDGVGVLLVLASQHSNIDAHCTTIQEHASLIDMYNRRHMALALKTRVLETLRRPRRGVSGSRQSRQAGA